MTPGSGILSPLAEPLRLAIPAGFAIAGLLAMRAARLMPEKMPRMGRAVGALAGVFTLGAVLWMVLEALAGLCQWLTPVPLAVPAGLAALGIGAARLARRIEQPRGPWPHRLRVAAFLLAAVLLAEPSRTWVRDLRPERRVVLLLDDSASMRTPRAPGAATPLARLVALLGDGPEGVPGFLRRLEAARTPVLRRFASAARGIAPGELAALSTPAGEVPDPAIMATDLSAALDAVVRDPAAARAVVLMSDGRHTAAVPPEDAARQLGARGIPVFVVPPFVEPAAPDAAILRVRHPDSVFETDRARFALRVGATALRGRTLTVTLRQGDRTVDEKRVAVSSDFLQEEVVLADTPGKKGRLDYEVSVVPDGGDTHPENNSRSLRMAVTDDRYQVLLVDRVPRWEFRYLRNLFHARDKSVQLQAVLLEPDLLAGRTRSDTEASARRPFGQSEATRLPADPEDWRAFDAVLLGDVPPDALTPAQWEVLRDMVTRQGALLVVLSGPGHMPRSYAGHPLETLLPFQLSAGAPLDPGGPFRMALSRAGASHPVMRLDDDPVRGASLWSAAPPSHWRARGWPLKPAAEVLLTAEPRDADPAAESLSDRIARLRDRDRRERENALVSWIAQGRGRVVQLSFDSTWRLRYGTGDELHHRFWGQLLRWGAGPRLQAGEGRMRLGTNRLVYAPGEPVRIRARSSASAEALSAVPRLFATVRSGTAEPLRIPLTRGELHAGLYEGEIPAPALAGPVEIAVEVPAGLREGDEPAVLSTQVWSDDGQGWIERADLSVDHSRLAAIARLSGGRVVPPESLADIFTALDHADPRERETRSVPLWSHPAAFLLLLTLLTLEAFLRRRGSLP